MDMPVRHSSDIDLFSDDALNDPYPLYRQLRDQAPAVWLRRHEVWFLGRYDPVRAALGDWQTWSSAQGIGLNPVINEAWRNALICVDPPAHTEMRKLFTDRLGPRQLKDIEATIQQRAEALAERIAAMGEFDAVKDVAQDLPVGVIMDLIGWPEDVRGGLLEMAAGSFDACGPANARMHASLPRLQAMMALIGETFDRDRLVSGGFGSTVADAARRGEIPREAAIGLLAGYVVAAFDTTISAISHGLLLFAQHPQQWQRLREAPQLMPAAFNEIVRIESPIQNFSRVATRDVDLGEGVLIPAGARAIVSYGAANRDERHFAEPERFHIERRPLDHLGFGLGIHGCAGQSLARLEGHAVFSALARRIGRLTLAGEPQRALNNINRGFAAIPMRAER
ncbi:cytochrome P450 [Aquabacterium sp.]|uniref:cytochrome P450 n=1 Tax=Aquabacterium sp. TaxID=1872578 RepID=UPI002C2A379E|nr:cytochrome P450 [Aquabacterium sp.]HSW06543.1 cytochrome P450 [Aquabacterium sp.]